MNVKYVYIVVCLFAFAIAYALTPSAQSMTGDRETLRGRSPTPGIRQFHKATGFPKGRPGYVADHIIPLCAGGPDSVSNIQWQNRADSYRKDVFERQLCAAMKREHLVLVHQ